MTFGWTNPWFSKPIPEPERQSVGDYMRQLDEWQREVQKHDKWVAPPRFDRPPPPNNAQPHRYGFRFSSLPEQRVLDILQSSVERCFAGIDSSGDFSKASAVVQEVLISPGWNNESLRVRGRVHFDYPMPAGTISVGIHFEFTLGSDYEVFQLPEYHSWIVRSKTMSMEMSQCIEKLKNRVQQLSSLLTWAKTVKEEFNQPHLLKYSETFAPSTGSTEGSRKKGQELMVNGITTSGSGHGSTAKAKSRRSAKA